MKSLLPNDLVSFLASQTAFDVDHETLETGRIEFHCVKDLRIGYVYVAPQGMKDPNRRRSGVYKVPAISLVKTCERYSPHHMVTYLPVEKVFAMFDGDHAKITTFPSSSWTDIATDPEPYINALWSKKPRVSVVRNIAPWERYEFWKNHFS